MDAELLLRERIEVEQQRSFAELVIWRAPSPLPGSAHSFKYRLAYVVDGVCVLRYDNESGKGDHRHAGDVETPYRFSGIEQLLDDFWQEVEAMR